MDGNLFDRLAAMLADAAHRREAVKALTGVGWPLS